MNRWNEVYELHLARQQRALAEAIAAMESDRLAYHRAMNWLSEDEAEREIDRIFKEMP